MWHTHTLTDIWTSRAAVAAKNKLIWFWKIISPCCGAFSEQLHQSSFHFEPNISWKIEEECEEGEIERHPLIVRIVDNILKHFILIKQSYETIRSCNKLANLSFVQKFSMQLLVGKELFTILCSQWYFRQHYSNLSSIQHYPSTKLHREKLYLFCINFKKCL